MPASFDEEPWEHDIQALLGSLPEIDPPNGFIATSINHRPLYAGRVALGLVLAASGVLAVSVGTGVFGPREVVPELASMSQQHDVSVAGFFGDLTSDSVPVFEPVDEPGAAPPVTMPHNWDEAAAFETANLSQILYAEGDKAASVFVEPGTANFDELGSVGKTTIKGLPAWTDDDARIVVVQTTDSVVTVVGLDSHEVGEILSGVANEDRGFWGACAEVADSLTTTVGFPDL